MSTTPLILLMLLWIPANGHSRFTHSTQLPGQELLRVDPATLSVQVDREAAGYLWSLDDTPDASEVHLLGSLLYAYGRELGVQGDLDFLNPMIAPGKFRLIDTDEEFSAFLEALEVLAA